MYVSYHQDFRLSSVFFILKVCPVNRLDMAHPVACPAAKCRSDFRPAEYKPVLKVVFVVLSELPDKT
jgi:hypothetical protein